MLKYIKNVETLFCHQRFAPLFLSWNWSARSKIFKGSHCLSEWIRQCFPAAKVVKWFYIFIMNVNIKKLQSINSTGAHSVCGQCGRPLAHVTHDLCCAAPQKPRPESERCDQRQSVDCCFCCKQTHRWRAGWVECRRSHSEVAPPRCHAGYCLKTLLVQRCKGKKRKVL